MSDYEHGDFLSAWANNVAERLARKAAEVMMHGAQAGLTFPQIVEQFRQKFDYQMIAEGQALMRKTKARPNETGRILKVISSADAALKRPDLAIVKPTDLAPTRQLDVLDDILDGDAGEEVESQK